MLSGNLVVAHTTVQSDKANDKVAKLCYTVRGPFQISVVQVMVVVSILIVLNLSLYLRISTFYHLR